jgi:hypothetical protein
VNYHNIQDIVERGEIRVQFIPSVEMATNNLTKGLTLDKFRVHVVKMRLVDLKVYVNNT